MKLLYPTLALALLAGSTPANASKTLPEIAMNYWGDDWSGASALPPALRFATGVGCWRKPSYGIPDHLLTIEQKGFLSDVVGDFVTSGCADVQSDTTIDGTKLKAHITDYHTARPNGKFIGYFDVTSLTGTTPGYETITQADTEHRNWFVYRQGCNGTSTTVKWPECDYPDDVAHDGRGRKMMDMAKSNYINFSTDQIAREAADLGLDGVLLDVVHEFPFVAGGDPTYFWIDDSPTNPGTECDWISSVSIRDYTTNTCTPTVPKTFINKWISWDAHWEEFLTDLHAEIATTSKPSMLVYANVPREEGTLAISLLPLVDGILVEDFAGPVAGENKCQDDNGVANAANGFFCRMKDITDLRLAADNANKPLLLTAQTRINNYASWCGGPMDSNWDPGGVQEEECVDGIDAYLNPVEFTDTATQHQHMRFYLAAYYIMQNGNEQIKFDHPSAASDQYSSMAWYNIFDCDLGTANNGPLLMTNGTFDSTANGSDSYVFTRSYSAGRVYLNTTNASKDVGPLGTDYYNSNGTLYPGNAKVTIPPDTGLLLFTSIARCDM